MHHHAHGGGCSHSHSYENHDYTISVGPCSDREQGNLKDGDGLNALNIFHDNHGHSCDVHIRRSDHNHHEHEFCHHMAHDNSCKSHSRSPKGGQLNHEQHQ